MTAKEKEQQQVITYVQGGEYYSNTTDEKLDKGKVEGARKEKMKCFERMGVYKKVPYTQSVERTGRKLVGIKWVDVREPDGRYRSRPVAKEFNDGIDETMHAAIPPLEALENADGKSFAVREEHRRDSVVVAEDDKCTVTIDVDVHRAFFNAHANPEPYVEL